jgi:S1-C subfamily serine protease
LHDGADRHSGLSLLTVGAIAIVVVASILGNVYTYQLFSRAVRTLENKVATLETRISALTDVLGDFNETSLGNVSLSELYAEVKDSVVLIRVETAQGFVAGSGFVYNYSGHMVINTNYHVIEGAMSIAVTFRNGHAYSAEVLGSDPYVDYAVLQVDAPSEEFLPLLIGSSSLLNVGDLVIAVGNPYELVGSMTTGIVSQLGRAVPEDLAGGYTIADVVQISAPINPGNSGGPLLNAKGQVVGITFAIIENSYGVGFAIPSDTILREIAWLARGDSYPHSWIGVTGTDMTYELAQEIGTSTTYGWRVVQVLFPSPAHTAGLEGGDIVLAINETQMINGDDISSYLERYTSPGQQITLKVERALVEMALTLQLGTRPPP